MPAFADSFTTFRSPGATFAPGSTGALFGSTGMSSAPPLRHSLSTYANDGGVKSEVDHGAAAASSPFSATPSPLVSNESMMQPLTINAASNGTGVSSSGALLGSGPSSQPLSGSGVGAVMGGAATGGSALGSGGHPAPDPAMPTLSPHPPQLKKEADLVAAR